MTFSVCCHPEILLPWQCDVTTFPLYKAFYSTASNSVVRKCCDWVCFPWETCELSGTLILIDFYSQPIKNNSVHTVWPNHSKNHGFPTPTGEVSKFLLPILQVLTIPPATQMKFTEEEIFIKCLLKSRSVGKFVYVYDVLHSGTTDPICSETSEMFAFHIMYINTPIQDGNHV